MKCRFLVLALVLAALPIHHAFAADLADVYRAALSFVSRHLTEVKLSSAYGTPLFDASGRRVDDVFLNFTGKGPDGRWMLMSLTVRPDDGFDYDPESDGPRPDEYGHHEKPALELDRWLPPEEAVVLAVRQHPGHEPVGPVSMGYHWSADFGDRHVIVLYWVIDRTIYHVVFGAKYGETLLVGTAQAPGR